MRILYVMSENINRTGGGIGHFLAVARGLKRLGHEVFIMAPQYYAYIDRPKDLKGIYVPVPGRSMFTLVAYQLLTTILFPFIYLIHRPQVVLARGGTGIFFLLFLVCRAFGVRVVVEINGISWEEIASRRFPGILCRL
ncbi:MAG: hypothetical protein KAU28_05315, partial [Phycisphaerae bacterium]|nr:hypothetical protein [Phycisphaerae bacterium]